MGRVRGAAGSAAGRRRSLTGARSSLYLLPMPAGAIASSVQRVRERVAAAARPAGREPGAIVLGGVGKTGPPARLLEAAQGGPTALGENRGQEARGEAARPPRTV